jgi:hypothetical protein
MVNTSMEKHIGEKLERLEKIRVNVVQGKEIFNCQGVGPNCFLCNKNQNIYNDQILYDWRKPAGAVILEIAHCAKITVMSLPETSKDNLSLLSLS